MGWYRYTDGQSILGRELGPSGVSPNQSSRWKLAFSLLKHLTYAFVTQQPFDMPYWNLDTCIFVARAINIFHHTNSFGCIITIRCSNACHGPHSDSLYSGSEHRQFNSPRLVMRDAGFPNPRRALIGSDQLWRVNDSPYYREYNFDGESSGWWDIKTWVCALWSFSYMWVQGSVFSFHWG